MIGPLSKSQPPSTSYLGLHSLKYRALDTPGPRYLTFLDVGHGLLEAVESESL